MPIAILSKYDLEWFYITVDLMGIDKDSEDNDNGFLYLERNLEGVNTPNVKRQRQIGSIGIHCNIVTLLLTLGNGSGTDFGASQCIPMGPCRCRCRLTRRLTLGMG